MWTVGTSHRFLPTVSPAGSSPAASTSAAWPAAVLSALRQSARSMPRRLRNRRRTGPAGPTMSPTKTTQLQDQLPEPRSTTRSQRRIRAERSTRRDRGGDAGVARKAPAGGGARTCIATAGHGWGGVRLQLDGCAAGRAIGMGQLVGTDPPAFHCGHGRFQLPPPSQVEDRHEGPAGVAVDRAVTDLGRIQSTAGPRRRR